MIDIVERLQAHMGMADIGDVLPDCREAAREIERLRAALRLAEIRQSGQVRKTKESVSRATSQ